MISLTKLCLNIIVQQFERFHFAFTSSNDETVERSFDFLQREYSFELGSGLYNKSKLKDDYLEFILNEHLKIFHRDWIVDSRYAWIVNRRCVYSMVDVFSRLPNLTVLHFPFDCNDEVLENLAEVCPKIVEVYASHSSVTDIGVKYLCKVKNEKVACPELKIIDLQETGVTDESVRCLIENLPFLERVFYRNVPRILHSIHKEMLPNPEKLSSYNLEYLDFLDFRRSTFYNDILKLCLTVCPRLKILKCYISDEEQLNLFNDISLQKLYLKALRSNPKLNINDFLKKNCPDLRFLEVYNCILSISDLARNSPKLEHLNVRTCTFSDDHVDSQSVFLDLNKCIFQNIKDERATDKAMRTLLLSSPNMERIEFYNCDLSSKTSIHILKCCENGFLKDMLFIGIRLKKIFIKKILKSCTSLTSFYVRYPGCTTQDIQELTEFAEQLPNNPRVSIDGC